MAWLNVVGCISAGFPSPAEGYEDDALDLHEYLVRHPAATFYYRVRGEDLVPLGILHDSVLVVDRSIDPKPGKLAVLDDNGELVVRKLKPTDAWVHGVVVACVTRFV